MLAQVKLVETWRSAQVCIGFNEWYYQILSMTQVIFSKRKYISFFIVTITDAETSLGICKIFNSFRNLQN